MRSAASGRPRHGRLAIFFRAALSASSHALRSDEAGRLSSLCGARRSHQRARPLSRWPSARPRWRRAGNVERRHPEVAAFVDRPRAGASDHELAAA